MGEAERGAEGPAVQPLFTAETHRDTVLYCLHALVVRLPAVLPFERVVRVLLQGDASGQAALSLARNRPGEAERLARSLVELCAAEPAGSWRRRRCAVLLEGVCALAPHLATLVREALVRHRQFPALVVRLGFHMLHDFVEFVLGLVYDKDELGWLTAELNTPAVAVECVAPISTLLQSLAQIRHGAGVAHQRLCGMMRTACVLLRPGAIAKSLAAGHAAAIARCVAQSAAATPAGDHFVDLALCVVACCPIVTADGLADEVIAPWLCRLVVVLAARPDAGYAEMLRLAAIHFWTGDIRAVADLVRQRLGFHVDVPVESLKRLGDIFTKQVSHMCVCVCVYG